MKRSARTVFLMTAACMLMAGACVKITVTKTDPRLGELGMVRFLGGGGCSSSTTMAVGSTATLDLEANTEEALPADLAVRSTEPTVIDAEAGSTTSSVVLSAHTTGQSAVELLSDGAVYDWLVFDAEPAASVTYAAPDRVIATSMLILDVDEVYGACGEECVLIGGEFIDWSVSPAGSLTFVSETDRKVVFEAGDAGDGSILGDEPSLGANLIDHAVTIVPLEDVATLTATMLVLLPDDSVLDPVEFPGDIPVGSLFLVQLQADVSDGNPIAVSRLDAEWSIESSGAVSEYIPEDGEVPEGPAFSADAPGGASLVATAFGQTQIFAVTVVE